MASWRLSSILYSGIPFTNQEQGIFYAALADLNMPATKWTAAYAAGGTFQFAAMAAAGWSNIKLKWLAG
jgi:hypothetical protein